jgi:uncharacterized membrane protein YdfJ with MMPL/SSD domain
MMGWPDLESESEDFGIDSSLIKMNEDAMKMLDAEMDRVAEISSRKSPSSLTPSSSASQLLALEEKEDNNIVFQVEDQNDDNEDDDNNLNIQQKSSNDDDSDNSSIMEELSALQEVSKQIEEELREETAQSMKTAMEQIGNTPAKDRNKRTMLGDDDREIIDRILEDGKKNKNPVKKKKGGMIWRICQAGISATETTFVLSTLCVVVWSIVFSLILKARHAEM